MAENPLRKLQSHARLGDNIIHFARTLRAAGMRVGPAAAVEAVRAVQAAGIGSREDFYWTLHCVLVSRREDHAVFDEAFKLFWRSHQQYRQILPPSPRPEDESRLKPPPPAARR